MPTLPSFTKFYWSAWLVAFALYLGTLPFAPATAALGTFALVSMLGALYVDSFEFGRLMGFLRAHCPIEFARFTQVRFIESFPLVHPWLVRRMWSAEVGAPEKAAYLVYRGAWVFKVVTLAVLIVLAGTLGS